MATDRNDLLISTWKVLSAEPGLAPEAGAVNSTSYPISQTREKEVGVGGKELGVGGGLN